MFFKRYPKIDHYIFVTALLSSLFALLLLGIIETFFTFLAELQELNENGYSISKMLQYLFYDTPNRLYRVFPMALLLGALLGLGQLSASNEMSAIRAAGLSKIRIILGAIISAVLLSAIFFAVGELVVPKTQKIAALAKNSKNINNLRSGKGFWAIADNKIIYVMGTKGTIIQNIIIYQIKDSSLASIFIAPTATLQKNNWLIPSGVTSTITPERIVSTANGPTILPTVIDKTALTALTSEPKSMAILHLWKFIKYLESNGLDASEYRLAVWTKVFSPLTNLSMLVIAAPFIFGHGRQQGLGGKLLLGIMIGLIIYLGSRMLANVILLYNYLPIFGAIIPIILSLGLGLMFFKLRSQS
jgi:lipopolysaccharide export system permease protein